MRFALVNGDRAEPQPSLVGKCANCGSDMIAKCGMYVRWHWAHKPRFDCDPWHEAETDWHLIWKDAFPSDCQESVQIDENTGEKHVADVKTPSGVIVEVQHSRISEYELRSRENFYGDMIWVVDARDVVWMTSRDLVCVEPMAYGFKLLSRTTLLERWSSATCPVYFDNTQNVYHDKVDDTLCVLPPETRVPISERTLWRVLNFDPGNNVGVIAPLQAQWMVEATMRGESVPLARCDERDAWRYRLEMFEIAGTLDGEGGGRETVASTFNIPAEKPPPSLLEDDDVPF